MKMYIFWIKTDKGWAEEEVCKDRHEAEQIISEWLEEFPNCSFKITPKDMGGRNDG
jgi:hypothetical protein